MQQRGSAGATAVMLYYSHKIVDLVRISLLSPEATRLAQESDNWGDEWASLTSSLFNLNDFLILFSQLQRLQRAIETD